MAKQTTKPAAKKAAKKTAKKAAPKKVARKQAANATRVTKEQDALIEKYIGKQIPQHLVHRLDTFLPEDKPAEILVKLNAMQQRMSFYPEIIEAFEAAEEADQTAGE